MADADPQARKTARVLYWLLRQRPSWTRPLQLLLDLLDNTARKHLDTEQYQSEYLEIIRNREYLSNIDVYDLDWKDLEAPQFTRNGSLSSSGRVSIGSDIPSLKSEDEDDLRKYVDETDINEGTEDPEDYSEPSTIDPRVSEYPVVENAIVNLREQTAALKSNKQFSASTGNIGRTGGIGGGCQRLSVASKFPQPDDENNEKLPPTSARATLSTSLMAKR